MLMGNYIHIQLVSKCENDYHPHLLVLGLPGKAMIRPGMLHFKRKQLEPGEPPPLENRSHDAMTNK